MNNKIYNLKTELELLRREYRSSKDDLYRQKILKRVKEIKKILKVKA